jgi:DNA-binding IclR family transcriptional regulator
MTTSREGAQEVPGMKALERAVRVLDILAEHPAGLSLSELAKTSGVPMTTLHRILAVLKDSLFIGETARGSYVVGVGSVVLARAFLDGVDLREVARPVMAELVESTKETCHLGVLASVHVVYLEKVDSPYSVRMHSRVGATNPAVRTAIGRAILAYSPPEVVTEVLVGSDRLFESTLDEDSFEKLLADVRERGYSCDLQENEVGICCVGAPVFDHTGRVVAGLSVSAPASRFDTDALADRGAQLKAAAARVSTGLGWSG